MTESKTKFNQELFIVTWVIACAGGYCLGSALGVFAGEKWGFRLGYIISSGLPQHTQQVIGSTVAGIFNGASFSIIASFLQWLVLRKYFSHVSFWVPISTVGVVIGSSLGSMIMSVGGPLRVEYFILISIIFTPFQGLISGFFEWTVLRKELPKAIYWIWARTISITILQIIFSPATWIEFTLQNPFIRFVIDNGLGIAYGVFFGIITGFTLLYLIKKKDNVEAIEGNLSDIIPV